MSRPFAPAEWADHASLIAPERLYAPDRPWRPDLDTRLLCGVTHCDRPATVIHTRASLWEGEGAGWFQACDECEHK